MPVIDTPMTEAALRNKKDCIVRETRENGIHAAAARRIELTLREQMVRAIPLLESAAAGHSVSMAAGDLLRDYRRVLYGDEILKQIETNP